MAHSDYTIPQIEVKLTSRGKYQWSIGMPIKDGDSSDAINTIDSIRRIDQKLRNTFPKNTADLQGSGTGRFKSVDEFDD